ncbi:nucleotide sugar dehydrogenase [Listeria floridensis FSL S10-1187]|uniref:UDP-glucose 6-dehydrogenase n=1 Tax=Listeria floridensis FSL S10-1187 TaxID=1265817 RepID=A0ABP3AZI0_9LIST|nr:UDP-glucose/GDP-mannose dehydrogenase family protein [Listeria floridensis]EUJ30972.1 nucleotide sugar dehydrogenase [Listeria floridensis FSL S10-1187]
MNIVVIGTGYVGLVTGVGLSDIGHSVICVDLDESKIEKLNAGVSPIYEPGIEDLIHKNVSAGRLSFTSSFKEAMKDSDIVYLAVGTPEGPDGRAEMKYIESAAEMIATEMTRPTILVVKSTVPVGTNRKLQNQMAEIAPYPVSVVSNPEFLREGSAVHDIFHGDRIVLGSDDIGALETLKAVNEGFDIPILATNLESAELIKYASNAFLATKISFINEIANICESTGGDIRQVSKGMGMDHRIGSPFLNAGIGYGGSCFPKDTSALNEIAMDAGVDFKLLREVIETNKNQRLKLVKELKMRYASLEGKKIAVLGVAFKPNTDDIRDAPAITIIRELLDSGAYVTAYDPIAYENAKKVFGEEVYFAKTVKQALQDAEAVLIVTEWDEVKEVSPKEMLELMKTPIVIDGRQCFDMHEMKEHGLDYYSVGVGEIDAKEVVGN